jgi:drug/metabolite transporter (DMT)-like permease
MPVVVALAVAIVAVSSSAPLIAYAAAPALAIAFWRNALAVAVLVPTAAVRRRSQLADLVRGDGRRAGLLCALAGLALAAHFGTWVPSAKLTSVATATAMAATQPIWAALIAFARRVRLARSTWLGIGVAVAGTVLATGADLGVSRRAVIGDLLGLAGGAAFAVYATLGEQARARTSTVAYTTVCYTVCAVTLGVVCLAGGVPLHGYDAPSWLAIVALTAGPQFMGHSLINYTLHRISATTVSVLMLLEVPGAALIGWALLGQLPRASSVPGLALLVVGVAVAVVLSERE